MLDIAIKEIKSGTRGFNQSEIIALAINEGHSAQHAMEISNALDAAVSSEWQSISPLFDALEVQGYGELINELAQW
ncbi:hypothetical protein ACFSJ3_06620 [Corallincola platygyrae]|uniref:Uncharacterized protein n=1 Tax=Corallincola platygyrae TaxID=1193278 RepID=A0ABW4XKZ4_9GAMM